MTKVYNSPPNWPSPPLGWTPPPGWQPDPAWGPPPPNWTFYLDRPTGSTRPPWSPPEEPEEKTPPRRSGRFLAVVVAIFLGLVAVVLATGGKIVGLSLGADGVDVEFEQSAVAGEPVTESAVADAQPELEARIADLEQQLGQAAPPETSLPDLSGTWQGDNGLSYGFEQVGTELLWFEEAPGFGVTAVGFGRFDGTSVAVEYEAFDGSLGSLFLTFDGATLSGDFGNGVPITMTR